MENTSQEWSDKQAGKIRHQMKQFKLDLEDTKFDREDPILVLEFLARFMGEVNKNQMS